MPFDLIISPYDLSARSGAAVAACWLGDRVATLMPAPGRDQPRDPSALARHGSPAFERLAESWRWSAPLWQAGVVVPGMDGESVSAALAREAESIARDPAMTPLKHLMDRSTSGDESRFFDSVCRDLVIGGSNPAVTVPMTSAVEGFASAHGLTLVRETPKSLMGRIERSGSRPVFRFSMLTVVQADASDLIELRQSASESLGPIRAAMAALVRSVRQGGDERRSAEALGSVESFRPSCERVLQERVAALRASSMFSGQRIKLQRVSLTGSLVGAGSAVRAALSAARAVAEGHGAKVVAKPSLNQDTALARAGLVAITVKPLPFDEAGTAG